MEENEGEDGLPLVTLKFISICQCCKFAFDSIEHLPYLLKCGHFFCKKCLEENFTDNEGIKCPIDGLVAHSIKELKLLNNLIIDKNVPTQRDNDKKNNKENNDLNKDKNENNDNNDTNNFNTCQIHKGQKLTHIVGDTKEIVCVYCAFNIVRKNPKCEVKELQEKFGEYNSEIEKITQTNQNNIEIIQNSLKNIKKNKENEEKNINTYFNHIFNYF